MTNNNPDYSVLNEHSEVKVNASGTDDTKAA